MPEQTRARYPDEDGFVQRDGSRIFYERYGDGAPTIVFLPTWSIVHSRIWKAQVAYFARHYRVLTFDGRGNGHSDRPEDPAAYEVHEQAADALAVMDATGTDSAVLVGLSHGARAALVLAGDHPDRVAGVLFLGPFLQLADQSPEEQAAAIAAFETPSTRYEGWQKLNRHYWFADFEGWLRFFCSQVFVEPHSTKLIEDAVSYGLQTTPESLIATVRAPALAPEVARALCTRVRCPVLVVHGTEDQIVPYADGVALASALEAPLVTVEHAGHCVAARDPVKFNLLLREFIDPPPRVPAGSWARASRRRKRALYISSPIGLGHAHRDVAIANELRKLRPDVEIDWLAQHPVTAVLTARGERIHPASAHLVSESHHLESESAEHQLHVFRAFRRMDEIMIANFMVFLEVAREERYDVWIGDEAWEIDYFLHENPELKTAAYVWLTDFVGFLPMPDGGEREAVLTADYNAEMIEQISRYPRVRDRAIFVGDPEDIIGADFGAGLPAIRNWTEHHFSFAGYAAGFDPATLGDRQALRTELGYAPEELICLVTAGGSGVGGPLLRRAIASFEPAKQLVPQLRMIVVAGPRVDPGALPAPDGVEVRPFVDDLYRHLAACDVAITHGGLSTTMELTGAGRPFLYFPLKRHFEQTFHVPHRLERYAAGRRMDYARDGPKEIATAIAQEIHRDVAYHPIQPGGATRAAALIAELL